MYTQEFNNSFVIKYNLVAEESCILMGKFFDNLFENLWNSYLQMITFFVKMKMVSSIS